MSLSRRNAASESAKKPWLVVRGSWLVKAHHHSEWAMVKYHSGSPFGTAPTNHKLISPRATNYEQQKKHWNFPVLFYKNQRLPILPGGLPPSTFGVCGLNCCVRHGNRWIPAAIATELYCSGCSYPDNCIKMFFLTNSLLVSESSFSLCICFQFHSFLRFGVSDSLSFARRLRLLQNWFSA